MLGGTLTTNKTYQQIAEEWPTINRGDGRIEIMCPHGIGHVSEKLSKARYPKQWNDSWMRVHGCDGCCNLAVFYLAEMSHAGEI